MLILSFYSDPSQAQNLVANGSFEQFTNCPTGDGQLGNAVPWNSARGTCDLYNNCNNGNYGVPNNQIGYQNARTGNGYAGFFASQGWTEVREYLQIQLDEPLEAGVEYCVEFYVCLGDELNSFGEETFDLAVNNLGAYFSSTSFTPDPNNFDFIPVTPQVMNDPTLQILTDTSNWMKVEGQFFANGGEQFLVIGSFHDEFGQNTTPLGPWGGDNKWSYYLIDDVSVTNCSCAGIVLNTSITNENCSSSDAQIDATASGGQGLYNYYLSQNGILIDSTLSSTQTIFDNLPAGIYQLAAIDEVNCEFDTLFTITNNPFPELLVTITDDSCESGIGSIEINSINGESLNFNWNDSNLNTNTRFNLTEGGYAVTIINSQGCQIDTVFNISTTNKPVAIIGISPSPPYQVNSTINVSNYSNPNAVGISSHYWLFSNGDENTNETFSYLIDSHENLLLTYIITNSDGCSDTAVLLLQVENEIILPNVITMNNDGINDVYFIKNLNPHFTNHLVILNRWGNIVYKSENYQNDWKPENLTEGVYFYELNQSNETGEINSEHSGFIHVLNSN